MYNLEELNDIQRRAVLDTEGAVLVTAGAGSGKTKLLTHRIAHLIKELNVPPYNILAITFTNKAAEEMRTRLQSMLGNIDGIWVFTFHAACVRILRQFIDKIGYDRKFTIYGEAETKTVIKRICKENDLNDEMCKRILSEISNAKNKGISPDDYEAAHKFSIDAEEIASAYAQYQSVLYKNNALDYDDLLLKAHYLLLTNQEARDYFQNKFRYIHIDEFQDTNTVQYEIAKILAGKHGNIFAVGDEDQCIYTWRGAAIRNIFDFQKDFNCKVYKLEQNYRSTSNILEVANHIIKGNVNRLDKRLWTNSGKGEKVVCFGAATDGFEADYVVRTIYELIHDGEYNYSDCAVLMRLNALTRPYEERFLQYGIPHRVYGGFKFYDRKEIKDVLAYARLAVNPSDDEALYRIINFPRRGIGESSIEKMRSYSQEIGKSAYYVVTHANDAPFPTALKSKLSEFSSVLVELHEAADGEVTEFFKHLLFNVLNVANLFSDDDDDSFRLENINELVNSVREFVKNNEGASVADYLQTVSLYSDTDDMNDDNAVTIATVHSAKGLEFKVVFVVGLEDGTFPSLRMNENVSEHIEEERRLMYVAVTRARKRLFLTYAQSRFLYGETRYGMPSRFLTECGLVERKYNSADSYTNSPSYRGVNNFAKSAENLQYKSSYNSYEKDYAGSGNATFSTEKFSGTYKSDFGKSVQAKPTPSEHSDKGEFVVGASVMHKRLGKGKIVGLESMGDSLYAKIDFERGGVMMLAVDFAPLTVAKE
ncbi:MAG: UvrD-helicase domain-containing protein [Clostridiales bacterium]|nr:UvrD-helicase domain-containing protein [Clostridiales bacterium]